MRMHLSCNSCPQHFIASSPHLYICLQDQHGITLLLECAAKALAAAAALAENLTDEQLPQLADALCLVIRPKIAQHPKHQVPALPHSCSALTHAI